MTVFWFGFISCVYGVLALLGIGKCPKKCRGTRLKKRYQHCTGMAFLILGIAWLIGYVLIPALSPLLLLLLALPAVAFSVAGDFKYGRLSKQKDEKSD